MFNLVQRFANLNDLENLNQLICDSRQHIGYDEQNNVSFIEQFVLTKEYINNQFVFVYETNNLIISMFGLSCMENKVELDYFFISPNFIGKGLGKKMWNDLYYFMKIKKWSKIEFISNPFAVSFYLHMGAKIIADYEDGKNQCKIMQYKIFY